MELRHLIDTVLLIDTKQLVVSERQIMSQVLHHLREIDRRKLYADLGFSSMFAYCTDELKYSPDQSQRRISACRMLAELPEIEKKLDDGSLNLTILGMANNYFKENNLATRDKLEILDQISNKPKREVEKMLAPDKPHAPDIEAMRKVSKTQTKITLVLDDTVVEKLNGAAGAASDVCPKGQSRSRMRWEELQALLSHSKKRQMSELIDFLCTPREKL